VHDNPALSEAARVCDTVIPLFVFDDALLPKHGTPRRLEFLHGCIADLRKSLRRLGADLVVRRGDPVAQTTRLAQAHGAQIVFMSRDASAYSQRRERRLAQARVELRLREGIAAVEPGAIVPDRRDHYRVFTPYWRRWRVEPRRAVEHPPAALELPPGIDPGEIPNAARGGETQARRRLNEWLSGGIADYEGLRDSPAAAGTSGLSAYLHFGCLSAHEVAVSASSQEAFVRQLCWRDFFLQLLRANPRLENEDLTPRDGWRDDDEAFARWRAGETGVPIVDAAMRQLAEEGWLPNRARLIVAGFLTKTLGLDWRLGADVFNELLVDADVASNTGNWQWVAGTGVDTRPRGFNAARQAKRFDPDGIYVKRYVDV
jgi:deoxyribodipyrimidine photo-lyase